MKKILLVLSFTTYFLGFTQDDKDALIGAANEADKVAITDTTDGWEISGVLTVNFSNVGLQNWAAGGSNSYSVTALTSLKANYTKGNSTWDNNLDLGLGSIQQYSSSTEKKDRIWVKSDDKIDFTSKYGQRASKKWFYSGLLNFKTQFLPGYDDPYLPDSSRKTISNFLSPGYGIAAIGMDYKPGKELTAFIAPLTSKITIVMDDDLNADGAFGVDSGSALRVEYGIYTRFLYQKDVMKNVNFSSKLELFANYQDINNIDVNWETLTSMKVNEFISATFATQLIYDNDIKIDKEENNQIISRSRVQFKHVLGIGLTYKF